MTDANPVVFRYELCWWVFNRGSFATAAHPEPSRIGSVRHAGRARSTRLAGLATGEKFWLGRLIGPGGRVAGFETVDEDF
jgi:hypothetical protein